MLLVYFSGVLGFRTPPQGFLPARLCTSHLSQLIYTQRLLFLEYTLPFRTYPTLGIDRRPRLRQHGQLEPVRQRYLICGSQSAFDEFMSLRAYGRVLASSDTPAFLLRWSDDGQMVTCPDGLSLSMDDFKRLPRRLLEEADHLCSELMFQWEPPMDLSTIKDDMTNMAYGYSFVADPRNQLDRGYLTLAMKACTSEQGGLYHDGTWDGRAIFAYLRKDEALRERMLGLMYVTGGQAPRGPELLSLRCQNGPTAQRGIFAYDGYLMYLTRHHKAKRSTNREFIVARFLPVYVGRLVFKYLVYIRPFVNLLVREQFREARGQAQQALQSSTFLFRARTAGDSSAWATGQLTSVIKSSTAKAWGRAVNLRLLRQLSIGVTEKHVREVNQPFNRFDDQSDRAEQNVAFAWQSGHRPLQRGRTYGLDGAFPTKLQPQLLELYEWASVRWHEFLHLPSRLAPARAVGRQSLRAFCPPKTTAMQPPSASDSQPPIDNIRCTHVSSTHIQSHDDVDRRQSQQPNKRQRPATPPDSQAPPAKQAYRPGGRLPQAAAIVLGESSRLAEDWQMVAQGIGDSLGAAVELDTMEGDSVPKAFCYNVEHAVIVCRRCASCIIPRPSAWAHHLRAEPHRMRGRVLQATMERFRSYDLRTEAQLRQQKVSRVTPCKALDGLATYAGYCCTHDGCRFYTRRLSTMKYEHVLLHGEKAGRHTIDTPLWRACTLQTYFTAKGRIDYFVVEDL